MKEATGELSTTVIAVVAIAAISALFVVLLLPRLRANIILGQACSNGPTYSNTDENGNTITCNGATGDTEWTCTYVTTNGATTTNDCNNNQN